MLEGRAAFDLLVRYDPTVVDDLDSIRDTPGAVIVGILVLLFVALGAGEPGSEIQAPMTLVILCGLLSSTAMNMLVVPPLRLRFGAVARRLASVGE